MAQQKSDHRADGLGHEKIEREPIASHSIPNSIWLIFAAWSRRLQAGLLARGVLCCR